MLEVFEPKRVPIEETEIFRLFEECATWVWYEVERWDWKAPKTLGIQLIRAIDSVNANLVEGDGRFTSADGLNFFVIARSSAREARLWIRRAIARRLVEPEAGTAQIDAINSAAKQLNRLIAFRRKNKGHLMVREGLSSYDSDLSGFEDDFVN